MFGNTNPFYDLLLAAQQAPAPPAAVDSVASVASVPLVISPAEDVKTIAATIAAVVTEAVPSSSSSSSSTAPPAAKERPRIAPMFLGSTQQPPVAKSAPAVVSAPVVVELSETKRQSLETIGRIQNEAVKAVHVEQEKSVLKNPVAGEKSAEALYKSAVRYVKDTRTTVIGFVIDTRVGDDLRSVMPTEVKADPEIPEEVRKWTEKKRKVFMEDPNVSDRIQSFLDEYGRAEIAKELGYAVSIGLERHHKRALDARPDLKEMLLRVPDLTECLKAAAFIVFPAPSAKKNVKLPSQVVADESNKKPSSAVLNAEEKQAVVLAVADRLDKIRQADDKRIALDPTPEEAAKIIADVHPIQRTAEDEEEEEGPGEEEEEEDKDSFLASEDEPALDVVRTFPVTAIRSGDGRPFVYATNVEARFPERMGGFGDHATAAYQFDDNVGWQIRRLKVSESIARGDGDEVEISIKSKNVKMDSVSCAVFPAEGVEFGYHVVLQGYVSSNAGKNFLVRTVNSELGEEYEAVDEEDEIMAAANLAAAEARGRSDEVEADRIVAEAKKKIKEANAIADSDAPALSTLHRKNEPVTFIPSDFVTEFHPTVGSSKVSIDNSLRDPEEFDAKHIEFMKANGYWDEEVYRHGNRMYVNAWKLGHIMKAETANRIIHAGKSSDATLFRVSRSVTEITAKGRSKSRDRFRLFVNGEATGFESNYPFEVSVVAWPLTNGNTSDGLRVIKYCEPVMDHHEKSAVYKFLYELDFGRYLMDTSLLIPAEEELEMNVGAEEHVVRPLILNAAEEETEETEERSSSSESSSDSSDSSDSSSDDSSDDDDDQDGYDSEKEEADELDDAQVAEVLQLETPLARVTRIVTRTEADIANHRSLMENDAAYYAAVADSVRKQMAEMLEGAQTNLTPEILAAVETLTNYASDLENRASMSDAKRQRMVALAGFMANEEGEEELEAGGDDSDEDEGEDSNDEGEDELLGSGDEGEDDEKATKAERKEARRRYDQFKGEHTATVLRRKTDDRSGASVGIVRGFAVIVNRTAPGFRIINFTGVVVGVHDDLVDVRQLDREVYKFDIPIWEVVDEPSRQVVVGTHKDVGPPRPNYVLPPATVETFEMFLARRTQEYEYFNGTTSSSSSSSQGATADDDDEEEEEEENHEEEEEEADDDDEEEEEDSGEKDIAQGLQTAFTSSTTEVVGAASSSASETVTSIENDITQGLQTAFTSSTTEVTASSSSSAPVSDSATVLATYFVMARSLRDDFKSYQFKSTEEERELNESIYRTLKERVDDARVQAVASNPLTFVSPGTINNMAMAASDPAEKKTLRDRAHAIAETLQAQIVYDEDTANVSTAKTIVQSFDAGWFTFTDYYMAIRIAAKAKKHLRPLILEAELKSVVENPVETGRKRRKGNAGNDTAGNDADAEDAIVSDVDYLKENIELVGRYLDRILLALPNIERDDGTGAQFKRTEQSNTRSGGGAGIRVGSIVTVNRGGNQGIQCEVVRVHDGMVDVRTEEEAFADIPIMEMGQDGYWHQIVYIGTTKPMKREASEYVRPPVLRHTMLAWIKRMNGDEHLAGGDDDDEDFVYDFEPEYPGEPNSDGEEDDTLVVAEMEDEGKESYESSLDDQLAAYYALASAVEAQALSPEFKIMKTTIALNNDVLKALNDAGGISDTAVSNVSPAYGARLRNAEDDTELTEREARLLSPALLQNVLKIDLETADDAVNDVVDEALLRAHKAKVYVHAADNKRKLAELNERFGSVDGMNFADYVHMLNLIAALRTDPDREVEMEPVLGGLLNPSSA